MSWYSDFRQRAANAEIDLLLRLHAPAPLYRIYGAYGANHLAERLLSDWQEAMKRLAGEKSKDRTEGRILDALAEIGAPAVPALAAALETKIRFAVWLPAEALGRIGEPALPVLLEKIRASRNWATSPDPETTKACIKEVAQMALRNPESRLIREALPELLGRVGEYKEGYLRNELKVLTAALKKMGEEVIPQLVRLLEDKDMGSRKGAAWALGELVNEYPDQDWNKAVPALVEVLKDGNLNMWRDAARVLVAIGLPALVEALKDADADIRGDAAWALGRLAEMNPGNIEIVKAAPALVDALKDADAKVRRNAAWALEAIAEKTEVDLETVREALKGFVNSVRKEGNPVETKRAEREAARHLIQITKATGRLRARIQSGMKGVMLEGAVRPPKKPDGIYRARQARAVVS